MGLEFTHTENQMNRIMQSNNSSGYKGVTFDKKAQKWRAKITIDGIVIHIGYYDTIEDAAQARVNRARQAFGQYVNASEGVNHGAKPIKIRKPKRVIQPNVLQPIVKMDIQKMYNDILAIKIELLNMQNALKIELLNL